MPNRAAKSYSKWPITRQQLPSGKYGGIVITTANVKACRPPLKCQAATHRLSLQCERATPAENALAFERKERRQFVNCFWFGRANNTPVTPVGRKLIKDKDPKQGYSVGSKSTTTSSSSLLLLL